MERKGILLAAGCGLLLALVVENVFSNRELPDAGGTAPADITTPHGDPPPPTTAPESPPGRTLSPDASRSGG